MNVFEKVFKALNKAKVEYLVVGGVAVTLHGYARFTGDLDFVVFLERANLERMDKAVKKMGYTERLPISLVSLGDKKQVQKWVKEKNLKAFSYFPSNENPLQIDIIISESLKFEEIAKNKVLKKVGDLEIPVVSLKDLIKMKKKASRSQDLIDIEMLDNISKL
ncbi:MAG: nucleotidyl transferase AbiEii/AbiGii toxin family protein [Candidatus Peregrinibacteria bacterium]|nr:nucleotidyl transferase AbiEii/AbiGii toxin family protein [Candidatus Peregrinibacteria bacterium]